jgi:uncharacterized RDD family membrane protein YckC
MERPLSDSELVVATPERVSFDYQVAGLGTRAIAQLLDLLILLGVFIALSFFASAVSVTTQSGTLAGLILLIGGFLLVFGYFWVSEALWSGQTVGKKVFRLRAVGDRGEPLTFVQAGVRNIVRIVDFLPYGYGVGLVVLFVNGHGKRLGDLAAGTIVVKDSDSVALWQLGGWRRPIAPPGIPPPPSGPPASGSQDRAGIPPPPPPSPYRPFASPTQPPSPYQPLTPTVQYAPASYAEMTLRRLDPDLRRFVSSYARRRPELTLDLRVQLASSVQPSLRSALPDVFAQRGPLAALDHLADLESM